MAQWKELKIPSILAAFKVTKESVVDVLVYSQSQSVVFRGVVEIGQVVSASAVDRVSVILFVRVLVVVLFIFTTPDGTSHFNFSPAGIRNPQEDPVSFSPAV